MCLTSKTTQTKTESEEMKMKKIEKITLSVTYIVYHLNEYAHDTEMLKQTLQKYLDEAWECVENMEASEDQALHVRDLARLVCMILDSEKEIVF